MARRTLSRFLLGPLVGAAFIGLSVVPAQATAVPATVSPATVSPAAVWSSSDQWGQWSSPDGYTLYNDIWGSGAGPQTIWANSSSNWGVWADHPNTGGVKSYPNIKKVINKSLSSLTSLTSDYNVTVPSSGAYNTSYDIWANNNAYEIMLWVNHTGPVGPIGSQVASVTVGGSSWNVYKGSNGSNQVFSFLRTSNSSSGTVDALAILRWIQQQGWYSGVTVGDFQFGYEITSSSGGLNFTTNSYRVSSS